MFRLYAVALKGDDTMAGESKGVSIAAIKEIHDRTHGKPLQTTELNANIRNKRGVQTAGRHRNRDLSEAPLIDLSRNKKQAQYFNDVMFAASGLTPWFCIWGFCKGRQNVLYAVHFGHTVQNFPAPAGTSFAPRFQTWKNHYPSFEKLMPHIKVQKDPG